MERIVESGIDPFFDCLIVDIAQCLAYKTDIVVIAFNNFIYCLNFGAGKGVGDAVANSKMLEAAVSDLEKITGQKPIETTAKKSISSFKLREGNKIGCKVTLRGEKMYTFLDKLISISLPRVRDFRGLSPKSFDGRGNYTIGIKEQLIFPEINFDEVVKVRGMDIIFVTTIVSNHAATIIAKVVVVVAVDPCDYGIYREPAVFHLISRISISLGSVFQKPR